MEIEDFIEKSKRRKISDLETGIKPKGMNETYNSKLDMRINELLTEDDNLVKMKLVFKLDYYTKAFLDLYSLCLVMDIEVFDTNRVFEKDLTSDLCIGYMATHYKESGERLYEVLNEKIYQELGRQLDGDFEILDQDAQDQVEIVLKNYFG